MATVNLRGSTLTVVYVDVDSVSGANDGSTPTDALQAFPAVTSLAENRLYIVRRTDTIVDYTKNTTSANRVVVMGMPTSGAEYYDILPTEVKTAWGADPESGVTFRGNNSTTPWAIQGENSGLYNIDFLSDPGSDLFSGHIQVENNNFYMKDCSVQTEGVVITATPSGNANLEQVCVNFTTDSNNSVIDNCVFQTNDDVCIEFQATTNDLNNITITNCDLYVHSYNSFNVGGIRFNDTIRSCVVENVNINTMFSDLNGSNTMYSIYASQAYECSFKNIVINYYGNHTGSGGKYGLYMSSTSYKSVIENFVYLNEGQRVFAGIYASNHAKLRVKNATITAPNANSPLINQTFGIYANNCDNSSFEDCTVILNTDTASETQALYAINSEGSCCTNCDFRAGGFAIDSSGVSFYSCQSFGAVKGANPFIHLTSFGNEGSTQVPFYDNSSQESLLYVETMNLSASAISSPEIQTNGLAIIEESPGASLSFDPNGDFGRIYVNNEYIDKLWHHETQYNRMFSTSVTRVSGGGISGAPDQTGYSIKANGIEDSSNVTQRAAIIAPKPFNGIPLSFTGTGRKRVTLYFAGRLVSPNNNSIWFELEVPEDSVGTSTKTITTQGYDLVQSGSNDTSVWEGDDLLDEYKVELEFELLRDEAAYGRIYFNQLTNVGYYYIDPTLFVEDL